MTMLQMIKKTAILLLNLLCLSFPASLTAQDSGAKENRFVIVIPSHNNKDWYQKNLDSVFNQRFQNYRVIYISDGSTDDTENLVEDYVKQKNQEGRFTLIKNLERHGVLSCMCRAIFTCDKDEIVVDLDGNDWFAHDRVLTTLNKVYSDPDVWMTYGQFMYFPNLRKALPHKFLKKLSKKTPSVLLKDRSPISRPFMPDSFRK